MRSTISPLGIRFRSTRLTTLPGVVSGRNAVVVSKQTAEEPLTPDRTGVGRGWRAGRRGRASCCRQCAVPERLMGPVLDVETDEFGRDVLEVAEAETREVVEALAFRRAKPTLSERVGIRGQKRCPHAMDAGVGEYPTKAGRELGVPVVKNKARFDSALLSPLQRVAGLRLNPALTGRFTGTLPIRGVDTPGVLLVTSRETLTASYLASNQVVATATALVDCAPPNITWAGLTLLKPRTAQISLTASEPVTGTVRWGANWDALTNTASSTEFASLSNVVLRNLAPQTTYYYKVEAVDPAGNRGYDSSCRTFTTPALPNLFTQEFSGDVDLHNPTLRFEPDGSRAYYRGCTETIDDLPTIPDGGIPIGLGDDTVAQVSLSHPVPFFGVAYNEIQVGSNGYITFGRCDITGSVITGSATLAAHFNMPRISYCFTDLNELGPTGGSVTWRAMPDHVAVTFDHVRQYGTSRTITAQVELFYNGIITISYLNNDIPYAIVGLSAGDGLDPQFVPTDLSTMGACAPRPPVALSLHTDVPANTTTALRLRGLDDGTPQPLTYIVLCLPVHGTLTDPGTGLAIATTPYSISGNGRNPRYAPTTDYYGNDSFTYAVTDGGTPPSGGQSDVATLDLLVKFGPPTLGGDQHLPNACIGRPYTAALPISQGQPPLTWGLSPAARYTETDLETNLYAEIGASQGWVADNDSIEHTLPFEFPYWGRFYNRVWISSNGLLSFSGPDAAEVNSDAALQSKNAIAVLWDDLVTLNLFIDEAPDHLTIRWYAATYYWTYLVLASATLYPDGRIQFAYGPANRGLTETVGLSGGTGDEFLFSKYNNIVPLNGVNSVEFTPVQPLPAGLTISPDGILNGTPSQRGTYIARVRVTDAFGRSDEAFLKLHVGPNTPGDMDCDDNVTAGDLQQLATCMQGPDISCPDACLAGDWDGDGDVDLTDWSALGAE